jgi:dienelactone hydrolase
VRPMLRRRYRPLRTAALAALTVAVGTTLAPVAPATAAPRVDSDGVPVVKHVGPKSFAKAGPYGVGETTLKLPGNHAAVEIWYPARRADVKGKEPATYDIVDWLPAYAQNLLPDDAAVTYQSGGVDDVTVARGTFPLVVFSHGYAGFPGQSSFLTSWLASWGFVVAAPDQRSRDLAAVLGAKDESTTDVEDLQATITLMTKQAERRTGRFAGRIDTTLVAAVGHSAGGSAVSELAAVDRRVDTFVSMAGLSQDVRKLRVPGLVLAGDADGIVELGGPDGLEKRYRSLRGTRQLVVFRQAGHHAFSDLCELGAGQGGLLEVADMFGFPVSEQMVRLASDGCNPPALSPTQSWPAIRQATVAHLRHVLGFDRTKAALAGLPRAYPGIVASSTSTR